MEQNKQPTQFFKVKSVSKLSEFIDNTDKILETSNLTLQDGNNIVQFEFVEKEENERDLYQIKPGSHNLEMTQMGMELSPFKMKDKELLDDIINTVRIEREAKIFFDKLELYERLNQPKKRSILFYSDPGQGKSATISQVCRKFAKEDKGTVIINWDTSKIRSSDVLDFYTGNSAYTKKCTRLIFIIEDIGGGEVEGNGGPRSVDTALLNLLDGIGVTFKLPTFIIATTNYPQNLLGALASRPGRFDELIRLDSPTELERVRLLEFFKKEELTKSEILAAKSAKGFSIAHLQEVVIRSLLHDRTMSDVVKELQDHMKDFEKGFQGKSNFGIGL